MLLYGKNGVIDTNDFSEFKEGSCAKIYKKENLLLKVYKNECKYANRISTSVFEYLRSVDIPNFVRLCDSFYTYRGIWNYFLKMDAYTLFFDGNAIPSLLDSSVEYFMDMVVMLEKVVPILSKYGILLWDGNAYNLLFTKNNVVILDPDGFSISHFMSKSRITRYNIDMLLNYLIAALWKEAELRGEDYSFLLTLVNMKRSLTDSLSSVFTPVFTKETPYLSLKNYVRR